MKEYIDPDGKQMLDKHRYLCHVIVGVTITNWLWAYWQGKYNGIGIE